MSAKPAPTARLSQRQRVANEAKNATAACEAMSAYLDEVVDRHNRLVDELQDLRLKHEAVGLLLFEEAQLPWWRKLRRRNLTVRLVDIILELSERYRAMRACIAVGQWLRGFAPVLEHLEQAERIIDADQAAAQPAPEAHAG